MENSNKFRPLYMLKILERYTDENHQLTTNEIVELLKENYDITTHRTTISADINLLVGFGIDVITVKSSQNKYYIGSRRFEIPELKLLIDAVQSSKFITVKKSEILVKKLTDMASIYQAETLNRNIVSDKRIKPSNEKIYYIVDALNEAINRKKKVSFLYFDYLPDKQKHIKNGGKPYVISPYSLAWNGDYYYLIGYCDERKKIVTFRVDRIDKNPVVCDESITEAPSGFDLIEYTNQVFQMLDGEEETVELRCDNELMKNIIDRFGQDVDVIANDDNTFTVSVTVNVSSTFFGWVLGFGGGIKIVNPIHIKEQYKETCMKTFE
ncbi:MAG: helix-turn-helix transcriptional regulator [Acutalibacteraceae bacterium]